MGVIWFCTDVGSGILALVVVVLGGGIEAAAETRRGVGQSQMLCRIDQCSGSKRARNSRLIGVTEYNLPLVCLFPEVRASWSPDEPFVAIPEYCSGVGGQRPLAWLAKTNRG
jgi:hypothetical protein